MEMVAVMRLEALHVGPQIKELKDEYGLEEARDREERAELSGS